MRRFLVALLVAAGAGCGSGAKDTVIPISQVPEALMKTARSRLPDVKFDEAVIKGNGVYEIRGKAKNGKVREVEVAPSGEVVAVE